MCVVSTMDQLKLIKRVKNSNPFTRDQSLRDYIKGVKYRIAQWYGIQEDSVTLDAVYEHLRDRYE